MTEIRAWRMGPEKGEMRRESLPVPPLAADEVLVRVSGCGVCHTDLGFFYEGIRTTKPPPLTLGHEISGIVDDAGDGFRGSIGHAVVVPAVLPCGECELCGKGRGAICRGQRMPGNHIDGGFASHVVIPGRYLCRVSVRDETETFGKSGVTLRELSVVADAVTTPYQAIRNSGLASGELAVFVGVGGIGGFGVQIAKALGAVVVAIDVDSRKLARLREFGADATFDPTEHDSRALRKAIRAFAAERSAPSMEWKIFECSGTAAGQRTAFGLLTHGATLCVVGFTAEPVEVRLSNLMAFDARAIGNWGSSPDTYPEVLKLVETGRVRLDPFVETFPLSEINTVFDRVHRRELDRRPILIPDFP